MEQPDEPERAFNYATFMMALVMVGEAKTERLLMDINK